MFAAVIVSCLATAQSNAPSGSISGVVADPQGQMIAGAKVVVRNNDLNTERVLTTDETGNFSAAFLLPGTYTVKVEAPGFQLKRPTRVTLNVGGNVRIAIRLAIASTSQEVTVTGTGASVEGNTVETSANKQDTTAGNFVSGLTVTYLPSRDRDFQELAELSSGTSPGPSSTGISVAGQRATAISTTVDGAEFDDPLLGGQRGDRDLPFFPQTVVREFQVVHSGAMAEVGRTNAGVVNIVTKSGSNKLHGEAFYIGRPAGLTSDDAFGHSLDNVQNEFGGSIGGPIVRNRVFFYAGIEQDFLHVPYWTEFEAQAPGTSVPQGVAGLQRQIVEKTNPTALFGRTDFILSPKNTLNLQLNLNRVETTDLNDGSTRTVASAEHGQFSRGNNVWFRANLTTLVSDGTVNQVLAQWGKDHRDFEPNSISPEVVINGFGSLGGNSLDPYRYTSTQFAVSDDVAVSHHSSLLHFGAYAGYDPARQTREANLNGRFDFSSLADYLAGIPRRFQQTFITGDGVYRGSVRSLGLYAVEKIPLGSKWTLTAGLRWDAQWNPQPTRPNPAIPSTTRIPNDLGQWQPRLGLAWNPLRNTVVRISGGLYDAPTPATIFQRVFTDNGLNTVMADSYFDPQILSLLSGLNQGLTRQPAGLTAPAAVVVGIAPDFRNPRSFQAAATVEQQLSAKVALSAGYIRNSTWGLQRQADRNLNPPMLDATGMPIFPAARPDPTVGRLLMNESSGHSTYDGLLLTANVQISRRSQIMANYTLSRARDDDSGLGPFGVPQALNPFNLAAERAYSSFDIRNNFNLSGVVNLPRGFKINPILVAHSGSPYTPVIGFDTQRDANDLNDRAILNGLEAPRNILRQPAFFNLDFRVVKDITLPGEGHHLDLFMDVFNITGARNLNFGADAISLFGTAAAPVFTAGQPLFAPATTRYGGARQVQFTVRVVAF